MIRQASIGDAEEIAKIHVLAWQIAYCEIIPETYLQSLSQEKYTANWQARLSKSTKGTLVNETKGKKIVGWVSFGSSRDKNSSMNGEIYAIYVHPEY